MAEHENHQPDSGNDPNEGAPQFNAGGNSSDYDGGQPQDSLPESEGRVDAGKEGKKKTEKDAAFNAGGNDSDYDGGHPKDAEPGSEGRIGNEKNGNQGG